MKKNRKTDPDLSGFFRLMLEELEYRKMSDTGRSIAHPSVCNICHILPKRIYKSVAKKRENILFLTDMEHNRFDKLLDEMDFEKLEKEFGYVWRTAVKNVLEMEHNGIIKERGKLIISILKRYEHKKEI